MTDAPGFAGVERRWGDDVIRVIVGEDESLLRRQMVLALEAHPRIEVAAEVVDHEALTAALDGLRPDVVVLDGGFPPSGAAEAVASVRSAHPDLPVVVVVDRGTVGAEVPGVAVLDRADVPARLGAVAAAVAGGGILDAGPATRPDGG